MRNIYPAELTLKNDHQINENANFLNLNIKRQIVDF